MKTLITTDINAGILGDLEFTASADCTKEGDDIVASNIQVSVFIPSSLTHPAKHVNVTHLISDDEIEVITEKIMEAYFIQKTPEPNGKYDSAQVL